MRVRAKVRVREAREKDKGEEDEKGDRAGWRISSIRLRIPRRVVRHTGRNCPNRCCDPPRTYSIPFFGLCTSPPISPVPPPYPHSLTNSVARNVPDATSNLSRSARRRHRPCRGRFAPTDALDPSPGAGPTSRPESAPDGPRRPGAGNGERPPAQASPLGSPGVPGRGLKGVALTGTCGSARTRAERCLVSNPINKKQYGTLLGK